MSERRNFQRFRSGHATSSWTVCAVFAACLIFGLPALADEIEPEPESESAFEAAPAPAPAPKPAAEAAPVSAAAQTAVAAAAAKEDECHFTPKVGCSGHHRLVLNFSSRFRWERWQAFRHASDNIFGSRTRIGADYYAWQDRFRLFGEGEYVNVFDLDRNASGAAALYRNNAHNPPSSSVDRFSLRQLFVQGGVDSENWMRVGRQDLKDANAISYKEGNWTYLKKKRLSQRLLGGVGWTNGERAYQGISARMEQEGHVLYLYVAEPMTGVFEIDRAYKRQKDVIFGGFEWTVERGTWFDNTELGAFFIGYADERDTRDVPAPFFGDINVYTMGLSSLGVYPLGPGNLDLIIWGAMQVGKYVDSTPGGSAMPTGTRNLDQLAGAAIAEVGYQLPDVWGKPWLRTGVNLASGNSSRDDGNRGTFFNLVPTNHLYYGYADQLAFSNLIDLLVQLKLSPLPKLGLELAFHQFWLYTKNDFRYFGSGVFEKRNLGYGRSVSNGSNNIGQEIDFMISYKLNEHVGFLAGVSHLFGGKVMNGFADDDANWAYTQVTLSY